MMASDIEVMQMISRLINTIKESRLRAKVILNFDDNGELDPLITFELKNESALKLFGIKPTKESYYSKKVRDNH